MNKTVIAVVDDMIFKSKIRGAAEAVGVEVKFSRSKESAISDAHSITPAIIVVDLQNGSVDCLALAREIKGDEKLHEIQLLGFFSHVEVQLRNDAISAGYDRVVPRSEFSRDLAKILTTDLRD